MECDSTGATDVDRCFFGSCPEIQSDRVLLGISPSFRQEFGAPLDYRALQFVRLVAVCDGSLCVGALSRAKFGAQPHGFQATQEASSFFL